MKWRLGVNNKGYGKVVLSSKETKALKARINERLSREDYTCRLPRPPKPRVRYKLTLHYKGRIEFNEKGYLEVYEEVYC